MKKSVVSFFFFFFLLFSEASLTLLTINVMSCSSSECQDQWTSRKEAFPCEDNFFLHVFMCWGPEEIERMHTQLETTAKISFSWLPWSRLLVERAVPSRQVDKCRNTKLVRDPDYRTSSAHIEWQNAQSCSSLTHNTKVLERSSQDVCFGCYNINTLKRRKPQVNYEHKL